MTVRIAINGFGRIGRLVARVALQRSSQVALVGINDIAPPETLAYLFRHDSVHGRFAGQVEADGDALVINGQRIPVSAEREPARLPWGKLGVDVVVESTGLFRTRPKAAGHLEAGARRVLVSAPGKEMDCTVVLGVNETALRPEHRVVSNASCTTNCLAPLVKVLDETFGFEHGVMSTVHAYTNDQRILDAPHKDLRRARAAAANIVPTTTGAAKAVGVVYPPAAGKLHGMAIRVPVPDGSVVLLVAQLRDSVDAEAIVGAFERASAGPLEGVLRVEHDPVVVQDIVGDPHSSIVDAASTFVVGDHLAHVLAWYDNEMGYAHRCVDVALLMAALDG